MNAFRVTARTVRPTRFLTVTRVQSLRSFGSTPLRRASEDAESFLTPFKNTPLFNKIVEQPEALAALSKVAEFLKKNDVDMTVPLSRMTVFKLVTNSEFRELTRNAVEEFRKAGIEIKPENAMELLSQSSDQPKGPR